METDLDLSYRIRQALLADPRTRDEIIHVDYQQGIIGLRGMVTSLRVAWAAEEIARQEAEGGEVRSRLRYY